MRVLQAALVYFVSVFAVGFLMGVIRVLLIVPRIGERWAELAELPLMIAASAVIAYLLFARAKFSLHRLACAGFLALVFLVSAEVAVNAASGRSLSQYITGRDPVSGLAYAVSLLLFGLMPLAIGLRRQS